jgi:tetratricopeptide (TPR) repeat protein
VTQADPADPIAHTALAETYVRQYETQPERGRDDSLIDRAGVEIAAALRYANLAPAHVVQALVDNVQRRPDSAIEAADRALAVNNRSSEAYRERGRAYYALGKLDAAEAELTRATTLAPDDWTAHHYLGVVYNRLGRNEEAAARFKRAIELAPTFQRAVTNLGGVLQILGRPEEAIEVLRAAAGRCECATAYSNLGTVYNNLGRHPDAVEAYEQAVLMPDARSEHWRNLGAATYWTPGLETRSREAYEQAAVLGEQEKLFEPQSQELLSGLADAYAVLNRREDSLRVLAELEILGPVDSNVLYQIGSVYEQLGERRTALDWLGKAVDAGKPLSEVERSPWLEELRKDEAYVRRFVRNEEGD